MAAITYTQIADELNISRSYLYMLRVFEIHNDKWDSSIIDFIKKYMMEINI